MYIGLRLPGHLTPPLTHAELVQWAKGLGIASIDMRRPDKEMKQVIEEAGLKVGSVDIAGVRDSLSRDEAVRREGVATVKGQIDEMAALGLETAFVCLIPPDPATPRKETFAIFIESYSELAEYAAAKGVSFAMEPYPGPAPHYPTIGCTPEMYRAMFAAIDAPALGICYDPSHYVRLGIDYLRVLAEFGDRVRHVHAKDTEILHEGRYLYGTLAPTFDNPLKFSGGDWRYCVPGTGDVNWAKVVAHLRMAGYGEPLSIELEDHLYAGSTAGSKEGVAKAAAFLKSIL